MKRQGFGLRGDSQSHREECGKWGERVRESKLGLGHPQLDTGRRKGGGRLGEREGTSQAGLHLARPG